MGSGEFTEVTRTLIKTRAGQRCEACGARIEGSGQIHHRQPRGMGGSRRQETRSAANGVYVHPRCHAEIESRRKRSAALGFLVGVGRSTEEAPIRLWDGWWLLLPDGSRQPTSPAP